MPIMLDDREPCTACDSEGVIPAQVVGINDMVPCPVCKGMGWLANAEDLAFRDQCDRHNIKWNNQ